MLFVGCSVAALLVCGGFVCAVAFVVLGNARPLLAFCLLCGGVGLEYGLVSLGLHWFLRLERALCWHSWRCLAGVAFSV